jgi:Zn-dependent peptidase ImmA (M78 family)
MKITRLDLDGTGSPEGIVAKILKAEPDLPIPVPIEDLARQLDITNILDLTTEEFEGALITDECRSEGTILVNRAALRGRRRFTIGHELGHFLNPWHEPVRGDQFLCSREDMRRWSAKENDAYARMEVEANKFSALILMPPPKLRQAMGKFRDPNLAQIVEVAAHFDVSKDAAARAYAEYHDELIAVAVIKDSKVLRIYRNTRFPKIGITYGAAVPRDSLFHLASTRGAELSDISENNAGLWLESEWGKRLPTLYEQVFFQQEGFALLMLWVETTEEDEDEDADERRTSKERYRNRQSGSRRW